MEIEKIIQNQHKFFSIGHTLTYKFRKEQLKLLEKSIQDNMEEILHAFKLDLNKCEFDAVTTEISLVLKEIRYLKRKLRSLMKAKKVRLSLLNFPAKGSILKEPYGTVLIMAPWNYPFQLALAPLAGAIAGGNTVVVKPSAYTPNVSKVIAKVLNVFNPDYITTILGGREQNQMLLDQKFDLIFFTGSKAVGEIVQEKAAKHLCPVVLELGGKSPCIVDEAANLQKAVKRIVWGKFLNAGQTCIAPDYIFVHSKIYDQFIQTAISYIKSFYYTNGKINDNFPYIVNEKHTNRLLNLIDEKKVAFGGKAENRLLHPTILKDVTFDDAVMQEEIFGPIMPVIKYSNILQVINYINTHDKPLTLYCFTKNKGLINTLLHFTSSGGVCINDVIMHFTEHKLPFGGVGASGMGNYHGKHSFNTFTHAKAILNKSPKMELPIKYPPYTAKKTKLAYTYLRFKKNKPKN